MQQMISLICESDTGENHFVSVLSLEDCGGTQDLISTALKKRRDP